MGKKAQGFTIVEIIVVIVAIAILVTIVAVSYIAVQQRSRDTALYNDLHNASGMVDIWLAERGNSIAKMRTLFGDERSVWIVGEGASNSVSASSLFWHEIEGLPPITPSPGTTLEVIPAYGSGAGYYPAVVNSRMLKNNEYCIAIASPGSNFDYKPGTGIHSQYDKMLYYDSHHRKIMTLAELKQIYDDGGDITCEGRVYRWIQATT